MSRKQVSDEAARKRALEMFALYQELGSLDAVGQRYEITRQRVHQILHEHGLIEPGAARRNNSNKIFGIIQKRKAGLSIRQIAQEVNLSRSTIARKVKKAGLADIDLRYHTGKISKQLTKEDVIELYKRRKEGESAASVARSIGIHQRTLLRLFRKFIGDEYENF